MRSLFVTFFLLISQADARNLVCVHGFMSPKAVMYPMARSFEKEGWDVINYGYSSRKDSIQKHAQDLVGTLKEMAQDHPGEPIDFISHSMGGLVVRAAVNHPDCPIEAKIGKAVLIATPNRGSIFARKLSQYRFCRWVLGKKAGKELMEKKDFSYLGRFPITMDILVIAGTFGTNPWIEGVHDGKVGILEVCLETSYTLKCVKAGHSWISMHPRTIRLAKAFLKDTDIEIPLRKPL